MQHSTEHENILLRNLWIDKKIPPLEYCSFERASRLLECEIEDLLHLYEIGTFNIAFKSDGLAVRFNVNFLNNNQTLETDLIHPVLTNQSLEMELSTIWYGQHERGWTVTIIRLTEAPPSVALVNPEFSCEVLMALLNKSDFG